VPSLTLTPAGKTYILILVEGLVVAIPDVSEAIVVEGVEQGDLDLALDDKENVGVAAGLLADHVAAGHPHTQYVQTSEVGTAAALDVAASGDAAANEVVKGNDTRLENPRAPTAHTQAISTITGLQGALEGKEDDGVAAGLVADHVAAADPHAQYVETDEVGTAAALNAPASGDAAADEVVKGNDSRLENPRTPTAHNQAASTITDFAEAVDDRMNVVIVAGANITRTYDDAAGTLTIASTGGGGGGGLTDTAIQTDDYEASQGQSVLADSSSGPFTVTVDMDGVTPGRLCEVSDVGGAASTNPITIVLSDNDVIINEAASDSESIIMNRNLDAYALFYNGTNVVARYLVGGFGGAADDVPANAVLFSDGTPVLFSDGTYVLFSS
jgi:hypothetical protein